MSADKDPEITGVPGSRETKRRLADWLTGKSVDAGAVDRAIQELGTKARDLPAQAIMSDGISGPPSPCAAFEQNLPEYAHLGTEAANRMPAVRDHLAGCPDCAGRLDLLRETHGVL